MSRWICLPVSGCSCQNFMLSEVIEKIQITWLVQDHPGLSRWCIVDQLARLFPTQLSGKSQLFLGPSDCHVIRQLLHRPCRSTAECPSTTDAVDRLWMRPRREATPLSSISSCCSCREHRSSTCQSTHHLVRANPTALCPLRARHAAAV